MLNEMILMVENDFDEITKNITDNLESNHLNNTEYAKSIYAYIYLHNMFIFMPLEDIDPLEYD